MIRTLAAALAATTCIVAIATPAVAQTRQFNISAGSLRSALDAYASQSGRQVIYRDDEVRSARSLGARGSMSPEAALDAVLAGSGFRSKADSSGAIAIVKSGNGGAVEPAASSDESLTGVGTGEGADADIIVTAQKRAERLVEVPQSVSVLSAEALGKTNATQLRDFANAVPGLTFSSLGTGANQISLRGITAGVDIAPTVAIYVDEVPYGSSSGFAIGGQLALDVGLFDVDRIEILRGPQGTLYGASALGGLIKYVSKRPDTGRPSGEAQAGISDTRFGGMNYNISAAANLPIASDIAAVRVSGFYSRDGGYIDNLALSDQNVNRSKVYGGRIDFLVTPTDQLSIRVNGFLQNIDRLGQATANYDFSGSPEEGSLDQNRPTAEPFNQHFRLASGTIIYDFGDAVLTSISSYQYARSQQVYDISRQFIPILANCCSLIYSAVGFPQVVTTKKFTQEARLASSGNTPLEWTIGGFYTHERSVNDQAFLLLDPAGRPVPNIAFTVLQDTKLREIAAFGDITYHFTPKFDVTAGVRWARNNQSFTQLGTGILSNSVPERESRDSVFTYLANARYHFNNHATAYVRYATGYRPGGPNLSFLDPTTGQPLGGATFKPDKIKSYEVGIKMETPSRRFAVDLAGYYQNWTDIQLLSAIGGLPAIANARGGATVRGVELSMTARPIRGLEMSGAFAYQDAHLSEADLGLGGRKGERLPNVPRFTASLNGDYTLIDEAHRPTIGITVRFVSDRKASFDASPSFPQYHLPAYTMIDLRAGASFGRADLKIFVRNFFDERAQLSANTNRGYSQPAIAQPRTIGVSASTSF